MPQPNSPVGVERRHFSLDKIKIEKRAEGDGAPMMTGHAAVFNQTTDTNEYWGFVEKINPGAFTETIASGDARALWNHNSDYVLGRKSAGTLRLAEDDIGLAIEIDTPPTTWANDLSISMQRGDIREMSFGFIVKETVWEEVDGVWVRTILKAELIEVSPVTFPAYTGTDISARTQEEFRSAKARTLPVDKPVPPKILLMQLDCEAAGI